MLSRFHFVRSYRRQTVDCSYRRQTVGCSYRRQTVGCSYRRQTVDCSYRRQTVAGSDQQSHCYQPQSDGPRFLGGEPGPSAPRLMDGSSLRSPRSGERSYVVIISLLLLLAGSASGDEPGVWLHPQVSRLPTDKLGPFVPTSDGGVLAIDSDATFVSSDDGETWSARRPLIGVREQNIKVSNHRLELSLAFSEDDGQSWSDPVVIARSTGKARESSRGWIAYPYVFERRPGELWITTMQGPVRLRIFERDLVTKAANGPVVTFGDSTTAPRGELVTYSDRLRQILADKKAATEVINAGVGGHDTDQARARFQHDVLDRQPSLVVIQFGINDAAVDVWKSPPATAPRVSLQRFEINLCYFVDRLRELNAEVILMTPNPMRWTPALKERYGDSPYQPNDPDGLNVVLQKYADAVRKIAADANVMLVDVYQQFRSDGADEDESIDNLLLDGIHPNGRGHERIADWILDSISQLTEERSK